MFTELSGIHNVRLFTYKELRHATDDFSDANKIGEGGFGPVYGVIFVIAQFMAYPLLSKFMLVRIF